MEKVFLSWFAPLIPVKHNTSLQQIGWHAMVTHMSRVGQNHTYIRCIYVNFGREVTIHTVIYRVHIRLWPTLHMRPAQLQTPATHLLTSMPLLPNLQHALGRWSQLDMWRGLLVQVCLRACVCVCLCVCICECVCPYVSGGEQSLRGHVRVKYSKGV